MTGEHISRRKLKEYKFIDLVPHLEDIWKKIIDKQIAENSEEWQALVTQYGSREIARDYLYDQFKTVAVCIDGDATAFFEKAGIEDETEKSELLMILRRVKSPVRASFEAYKEINIIWIPASIIFRPPGKPFETIHEMTHAADRVLSINKRDDENGQRERTEKLLTLHNINQKLALLFLGSQLTILALGYSNPEFAAKNAFTQAMILSLTGVTTSLFRMVKTTNRYNQTDREQKANRYAQEILNEEL